MLLQLVAAFACINVASTYTNVDCLALPTFYAT